MQESSRRQLFRFDQRHNLLLRERVRAHPLILFLLTIVFALPCPAQSPSQAQTTANDSGDKQALQELQSEIHELKQMVQQLQQQTVTSRAEIKLLRDELVAERTAATST